MSLAFAVVGGGWYGCHIAASFLALGFNVTLFEQRSRLLHEASGNNQFRLHLGFHYPRHYRTRMQSRDGFARFVERYPNLSKEVTDNVYAIPQGESLMDFPTYKLIMTASGIEFAEPPQIPVILKNIEGCLQTTERVLLLEKARRHFENRLSPNLALNHKVSQVEDCGRHVIVDGAKFDFMIDATWGRFSRPPIDVYYEPTLLLYYEGDVDFPAVTFVDGPLCSIYPTEAPGLFTLSSVPHTPLGRCSTAAAAGEIIAGTDATLVTKKMAMMERQISAYIPSFRDRFTFAGPQFAIKTKPVGRFDDRSCYIFQNGRCFSVLSGKIDTVFFAADRILSLIEGLPETGLDTATTTLRAEVAARNLELT